MLEYLLTSDNIKWEESVDLTTDNTSTGIRSVKAIDGTFLRVHWKGHHPWIMWRPGVRFVAQYNNLILVDTNEGIYRFDGYRLVGIRLCKSLN